MKTIRLGDDQFVRISQKEYEILKVKAEKKGKSLGEIWVLEHGSPTETTKSTVRQISVNRSQVLETVKESETEEDYFDCKTFCRRFRECTSHGMNHLGEILANHCYVSVYPYEWTPSQGRTIRVCGFMYFPNDFAHDPENPHPRCLNPSPNVALSQNEKAAVPNPQICWICVKIRKQKKEQERAKVKEKAERERQREIDRVYRGQPRVSGVPSDISWFTVWR